MDRKFKAKEEILRKENTIFIIKRLEDIKFTIIGRGPGAITKIDVRDNDNSITMYLNKNEIIVYKFKFCV